MKRTNLLAKAGLLFAAGATLLFAGCDNGNDDAVVDYPQFAKEAASRSIALLTQALPELDKLG